MESGGQGSAVLAVKDSDSERPVPTAWRPTLSAIVRAFLNHDYSLAGGLERVEAISPQTAAQIREYIESYGEVLVELPEDTWSSSVCIWNGTGWDALVDLWTESEGRSDLVLGVQALETHSGFLFKVYMVYVP